MRVSIQVTRPEDAHSLAQIQQAAFRPLYEKYQDEKNPFLRGPEDILCRLNKANRYYTIFCDDTMVGGIFYRLYGQCSPVCTLGPGEYYLARIYIHPVYQGRGIARSAILLCEKEMADAHTYFVDFPADLDKNRQVYQSAGFRDTGRQICKEGTPRLALFQKTAAQPDPDDVSMPLIYPVEAEELPECLSVIHESFQTVAESFGLTRENCPKHTSFLPLSFLETQMQWGWHMYGLYAGKKIIGYMSLSRKNDQTFELHNLAVLPQYRHNGFGKQLLDFAKETVQSMGGTSIQIGIIEESTVLKNWYIRHGFVHKGVRKFDHLPFTSGYLEWNLP